MHNGSRASHWTRIAGVAVVLLAAAAPAAAQERPTFYVHGGGFGGGALLSSDEIGDLVPDYGLGMSTSYGYLVRAGFGQVLQAEYRKGQEGHDLRRTGFVGDDLTTIDERPMEYEFTEWTVKLNPRFGSDGVFPLFLVYGRSDADYFNQAGEGFTGEGTILGAEFIGVGKHLSATFGLKRHSIDFRPVSEEFFGAAVSESDALSASDWVLDLSVAFGLGM